MFVSGVNKIFVISALLELAFCETVTHFTVQPAIGDWNTSVEVVPSTIKAPFKNVTQKLPSVPKTLVSLDECKTLDTDNCMLSANSEDCRSHYFSVICSQRAKKLEIISSMKKIQNLQRNWPIAVHLDSFCDLSFGLFTYVKDNIMSVRITNAKSFSITFLRTFDLPNLIELEISNVTKLELHKNDLDVFPKLRILKFHHCTFTAVEEGVFDNLYALKLLSLEWAASRSVALSELDYELLKLHCDCGFAWLRNFFRTRPYLQHERKTGEIYQLNGLRSGAASRSEIFVPVNCAKPESIDLNEDIYSVNDYCCSASLNVSKSSSCALLNKGYVFSDPTLDPEQYTESEIRTSNYVRFVIYPILLICCTVGNTLNLIILTHEPNKTSTNSYLLTITISDLFVMWLNLPLFLKHYLEPSVTNPANSQYQAFAKAFWQCEGLNEWGRRTFILLSDWTVLLFSLERLLVITQPLKFHRFQSATRGWLRCAALLLIASLYMLHHMVAYYAYDYQHAVDETTKQPAWVTTWVYVQQRAEVTDLIFNFMALAATNACIIAIIERRRKRNVGVSDNSDTKQRFRSRTILLLGCSALFHITHLPWLIHAFLEIASETGAFDYTPSAFRFAFPLLQTCVDINYCANCYVYLLVSSRYRKELVILFQKLCHKRTPVEDVQFSRRISDPVEERKSVTASMQSSDHFEK